MPIILPLNLTPPEIRVLQEFRRRVADTLPLATLAAVKHPAGGGEASVGLLADRGFLEADAARETFTLTSKAREFLAIEALPEVPAGGEAVTPDIADPGVDEA